jgi:hypothetical protein
MTESTSDTTTETRKKDLFLKLVESQDGGASVSASRKQMAEEFSITVDEVVSIEREGISSRWPPLS